jgi:hypothetical protein
MGEKVYKPIVKDGNHLLRSKDNPDRMRGLTRDENGLSYAENMMRKSDIWRFQ